MSSGWQARCLTVLFLALFPLGADRICALQGPMERPAPAYSAIEDEALFEARSWVEAGGNIDARMDDYGSRLHHAARSCHLKVAEYCISQGADVNHPSRDGVVTPLWEASSVGYLPMAELLIRHGAKTGRSELLAAVEQHRASMVAFLLDHGADPNGAGLLASAIRVRTYWGTSRAVENLLLAKGAKLDVLSAAALGKVEELEKMLEADPALLRQTDWYGAGPLHYAAMGGSAGAIDLLVRRGMNIEAPDGGGRTPLHYAARMADGPTVRRLVALGARVEARSGDKNTPLHEAVTENGRMSCVEVLLELGADIDARDNASRTPLLRAKRLDIIALLLDRKAKTAPEDRRRLLCNAADSVDHLRLLMAHGLDLKEGSDLLHRAAMSGQIDPVRFLLGQGLDPNRMSEGWRPAGRPLHFASSFVVANYLIDGGADVNADDGIGRTPLDSAAEKGDVSLVQVLLERGAKPTVRTLGSAVGGLGLYARGSLPVVRLLLDAGVKPDKPATDQMLSASKTCEMAGYWLQREADVNAAGGAALLSASSMGRTALAKLLLDHGADANVADNRGRTPLLWASQGGNLPLARWLLDRGADVNRRDSSGENALYKACLQKRDATARLLLENGADAKVAAGYDDTPLHAAVRGEGISMPP